MMHPGLNLYDYVYMRRFNNAMNNCNENEKIPPVNLLYFKEQNVLCAANNFS